MNPYTPELKPGYRQHASGLLVPNELSRKREVWTRDEWKVLERATKLLGSRGVDMFLRCENDACKAAPMERIRRNDGGITLRCACTDREMTRF